MFARAKGSHQITIEIPASSSLFSTSDDVHFIIHTPYTFEFKESDALGCSEKGINKDLSCFFALDYREIKQKLNNVVDTSTETKFGKNVIVKDFAQILTSVVAVNSSDPVLVNLEVGLIPAPQTEILISDFVFSVFNR